MYFFACPDANTFAYHDQFENTAITIFLKSFFPDTDRVVLGTEDGLFCLELMKESKSCMILIDGIKWSVINLVRLLLTCNSSTQILVALVITRKPTKSRCYLKTSYSY